MSKANAWQWCWKVLIFRRILGPYVLGWVPNHFILGAQLAPGEKRLVCIPDNLAIWGRMSWLLQRHGSVWFPPRWPGFDPQLGQRWFAFFTCYIVSIYDLLCEKSPVQVKEPFFFFLWKCKRAESSIVSLVTKTIYTWRVTQDQCFR